MQPTFIDAFSAPTHLPADRTALVVVDMQNATGNRHMGLGTLLERRGEAANGQYRFDRIENMLIPNIGRLLDHFRTVGGRVIFVTYGAALEDCSDVSRRIAGIVKATRNIVGHPEHEIVSDLAPREGELVLNKSTMGAFQSTGIDTHLRAMGVETVVFTGVSTNNCVAMTAMEARDRQYGVVVVSDATGTDSEEMQQASLNMLRRLWSTVMTTDEVVKALLEPGS